MLYSQSGLDQILTVEMPVLCCVSDAYPVSGLDSLVLASERNTMKFPSAYLPGFFAAKTSLALNLFSVRDNSLPHILFHIRTGIATDSYNLVRRQKSYKMP